MLIWNLITEIVHKSYILPYTIKTDTIKTDSF